MVVGHPSSGRQHNAVTRQDAVKIATQTAAAAAIVAVTTALARAVDVDLTAAALLLLLAALLATLLGRAAAVAGTVGAFLALNYYFTDPRGSFDVQKQDDLVALVVFAAASAVLGWTVWRLDEARRKAEQREHETHIRLDLTTRLMAGEDPETVVAGAAEALVALFDLVQCTIRSPATTTTATAPGTPGNVVTVRIVPLEVEAVADRDRPLAASDRALLEALVAGLAAVMDRLRLQDEARDARIDAQVGRTRSGFLSAVTHNLRTPLASIKAASSTLRAPDLQLDPDDRKELVETIYDETERLERLVTNILELSRIRAGALDVRRQLVDVRDLVQAAVRRLRPLARAHRIRVDVAPGLGDVEVDVELMAQVFGNLLENALRFAPPGSEILVTARSAVEPSDPSGLGLQVTVADHGPGVPISERERIFEEFARVDARPDATGTGLGLAIVHALVTAHGGRVWCDETPGGGATFVFVIPAHAIDARAPDPRADDAEGQELTR
jgi:two-component system sensor histidine kinase KdpD